jgi:hypothetical protein
MHEASNVVRRQSPLGLHALERLDHRDARSLRVVGIFMIRLGEPAGERRRR